MKTLLPKLILALPALISLTAAAETRYVDLNSPNSTPPYTNWPTAATNIQDAMDAAVAGDDIVVTNGTYATGGRAVGTNILINRVVVDKPVILRSVNGPEFTIIQGHQVPGTTNGDAAIRGVYLTNGSIRAGFTVAAGATRTNGDFYGDRCGGGIFCEADAIATNCVIMGNNADYGGGGGYGGTVKASTFVDNFVPSEGGGALRSTLLGCNVNRNVSYLGGGASESIAIGCTFAGNTAAFGGAASYCEMTNCTLTANTGLAGSGGTLKSTLSHCLISNNSGGGTTSSWLYDCSIIANSSQSGGGDAAGGELVRCILANNSASDYGGGAKNALVNQCSSLATLLRLVVESGIAR